MAYSTSGFNNSFGWPQWGLYYYILSKFHIDSFKFLGSLFLASRGRRAGSLTAGFLAAGSLNAGFLAAGSLNAGRRHKQALRVSIWRLR